MNKKILLLVLSCAMVVGIAVGGTMAWLTGQTTQITNTFTTSDINITIGEEAGTLSTEPTEDTISKEFPMVPGHTIEKDPYVVVEKGSEPCLVFVKAVASNNLKDFITWVPADGWNLLTGTQNVYYREVQIAEINAETEIPIIKGDQVTVNSTVTKENLNDLTAETYPTLTFQAFAIQLKKNATEKFAPADAWDEVTYDFKEGVILETTTP